MSTTTHRINLNKNKYLNVSNGNINCTLVVLTGQRLRVIVDGVEPNSNSKDYIPVSGPASSSVNGHVACFENLEADTEVWVLPEAGQPEQVQALVVRGPTTITFSGQ